MKRTLAAIFALTATVCAVRAEVQIPENFYLNNESVSADAGEGLKILPSTLRLVLTEGEAEVLSADVLPDGANTDTLSWSLSLYSGAAEIYPRGSRCTVLGVREGEERLLISLGAKAAFVDVTVKKAPEIRTRTFEYEVETKKKQGMGEVEVRTILRTLITLGALLVFSAVLLIIYKKRMNNK